MQQRSTASQITTVQHIWYLQRCSTNSHHNSLQARRTLIPVLMIILILVFSITSDNDYGAVVKCSPDECRTVPTPVINCRNSHLTRPDLTW